VPNRCQSDQRYCLAQATRRIHRRTRCMIANTASSATPPSPLSTFMAHASAGALCVIATRGRKLRTAGRIPTHLGGCHGMTGNHTHKWHFWLTDVASHHLTPGVPLSFRATAKTSVQAWCIILPANAGGAGPSVCFYCLWCRRQGNRLACATVAAASVTSQEGWHWHKCKGRLASAAGSLTTTPRARLCAAVPLLAGWLHMDKGSAAVLVELAQLAAVRHLLRELCSRCGLQHQPPWWPPCSCPHPPCHGRGGVRGSRSHCAPDYYLLALQHAGSVTLACMQQLPPGMMAQMLRR
jgi:hypothetical protein